MQKRSGHKVFLLSHKKGRFIYIDDIIVINTRKNYINIYTINGTYYYRSTFRQVLKYYSRYQEFIMPTYGILINMNYIDCINYRESTIYMITGEQYFITRKYRRNLYLYCQQYVNGQLYNEKC